MSFVLYMFKYMNSGLSAFTHCVCLFVSVYSRVPSPNVGGDIDHHLGEGILSTCLPTVCVCVCVCFEHDL